MNSPEPASFPSRLAELLLRGRAVLLVIAGLLTLGAIRPAGQLRLDESIESFYARDDPDLRSWLESKEWFGGDEFVMVAYQREDLLSASHLLELRGFADQFRFCPGEFECRRHDDSPTIDVWRRTALAPVQPLSEYLFEISPTADPGGAPEVTGCLAAYASETSAAFDLFACGMRDRQRIEAADAVMRAVDAAGGTTLEMETDDNHTTGVRIVLPDRSGIMSWNDDGLLIFLTHRADNGGRQPIDMEAVRRAYLDALIPGIVHEQTKDLGSTLNFRDAPAFQDMSPLVRAYASRFFRAALLDFSRNALVGSLDDLVCPRQLGPWRRTALDPSTSLTELRMFLSRAGEKTGSPTASGGRADYHSDLGKVSVFRFEASREQYSALLDAAGRAVELVEGSSLTPDAGEGNEVTVRQPGRTGLVSWSDGRATFFITDDDQLDLRTIRQDFLETAPHESQSDATPGGPSDDAFPPRFGVWQRHVFDPFASVGQLLRLLSGSVDVSGYHAVYGSGGSAFDVFALNVLPQKQSEVEDSLTRSIELMEGATVSDALPAADTEDEGVRFSQPERAGALFWYDDWLLLFVADEGADVGSIVAEYLETAEFESDATAVMIRLESDQTDADRRETLRRIRERADAYGRPHDERTVNVGENPGDEPAEGFPVFVAGEPVQIHDMFRYVEQDAATLGWATSGMLMIVILALFRSLRWVLLPLIVVHATILWTKALLVITNLKLSMVSSMLTSLVTIIGIATVMHVTVTFRELRAERDRAAAFRETFRRLSPAVFWTCVTTAIGFLALLSSEIVPVRSFGLMVALGALLVLATSALILPGGILIGRLDADPRNTPAEGILIRMLLAVTAWVERRPATIMLAATVLVVLAALGLTRVEVETDFSKNFRADSEIARSIDFFESHLGGAGNWEVNFPAPAELNDEYLDRVRTLANGLRGIEMADGTRLSKVYALTDGLDLIQHMGDSIDERREVLRGLQPDFEPQLYNPEAGRMRLFLRAHEQRPAEIKLALIAEVERRAREVFPESRTTGIYVLIANLITSLLDDQLKSFTWAAVGIAVAMTIAFRNLWIGLAGLVPNAFPILVVIGGMGWLGVPLNIGTAMIACVSMGLTVDSSIHYLTGYRRARESGRDHHGALREAHASVGRALVFANIALIAGFSVLTLSHFIPLVYFGVLVSVAMLGGLVGNLVLLPILLRWVPMRF